MPSRVLVADDDDELRRTVVRVLERAGFSVSSAKNGSEARLFALDSPPDLALLDADMPGIDGHALCRLLKKGKSTAGVPVVIMSGSLVDADSVVAGLDGGADDYVLKPFSTKVLLARIGAVLRRYARTPEENARLRRRGIVLDPASREVRVRGRVVALTRMEFDLLALLLANPGKVLSPNQLLETLWGYDLADYNDPQTVQTHVSRLRRKLGPKEAACIVNVHGVGYKLED